MMKNDKNEKVKGKHYEMNGETAYTEIHLCPMCGRNLTEA